MYVTYETLFGVFCAQGVVCMPLWSVSNEFITHTARHDPDDTGTEVEGFGILHGKKGHHRYRDLLTSEGEQKRVLDDGSCSLSKSQAAEKYENVKESAAVEGKGNAEGR